MKALIVAKPLKWCVFYSHLTLTVTKKMPETHFHNEHNVQFKILYE